LRDLFGKLMCEPESREQLRAVLITTYFAREVQPALVEQGSVNQEAYHYSKELLKGIGEGLKPWGEADSDEKTNKVRDQGFRRAIVTFHILTLSDRSIFRPDDKESWPSQKNLERHRKDRYCG